jgi:protein-disulfide isomerase
VADIRKTLADVAMVVMGCCVLVMTFLVVRREAGWNKPKPPVPERVPNWEQLISTGHRVGRASAPITILEFADYECPACARYEPTLRALLQTKDSSVALVVRQWPLPYHKQAYRAARVALCASAQGAFYKMHTTLYDKTDSLGLLPAAEWGKRIDIPNLETFVACAADTSRVAEIDADIAAARAIKLPGTPGIVVNGWRWHGQPKQRDIDSILNTLKQRGQ